MPQTPEDVVKMEKTIFDLNQKLFLNRCLLGGMLLFYDNIANSI